MFFKCVDCEPSSFGEECQYWSTDFLPYAEAVCGITDCAALALACTTDDDCDGDATTKCVIQADGLYAQVRYPRVYVSVQKIHN